MIVRGMTATEDSSPEILCTIYFPVEPTVLSYLDEILNYCWLMNRFDAVEMRYDEYEMGKVDIYQR